MVQWYFIIGAKGSPHQIASFQTSHAPIPPPPPPRPRGSVGLRSGLRHCTPTPTLTLSRPISIPRQMPLHRHASPQILGHTQARLFLYAVLCDCAFGVVVLVSSVLRLQGLQGGFACSVLGLMAQWTISSSISYTATILQDLLTQVYDPFTSM